MSPRWIAFITFSYFCSVLICMVLEGTYFSSSETSLWNDLAKPIVTIKVGGLIPIPSFNLDWIRGIYRSMTFQYSFYSGGFEIVRWLWIIIFVPAMVWGMAQVFAPVFANMLRLFR